MATAAAKTETKSVETEVSEKVVKLELTTEEAGVLHELAGSVVGDGASYRKVTDAIYFAMGSVVPFTYRQYFSGSIQAKPRAAASE